MSQSLHLFIYNSELNNINIYAENKELLYSAPLGDTLFSFLELDFSDYEKVRSDIVHFYDLYKNISVDMEDDEDIYSFFADLQENYDTLNKIDFDTCDETELMYSFGELLTENNKKIKNSNLILSHPYIKYSDLFTVEEDIESNLEYDLNLDKIKKIYKNLLLFCSFDNGNKNMLPLTLYERYYLFWLLHPWTRYFIDVTLEFHYENSISNFKDQDYTIKKKFYNKNHKDIFVDVSTVPFEVVDLIKRIQPIQMPSLMCPDPRSIAYYELFYLMNSGAKIKICKNCNKFFIEKGDYNTEYCDRIVQGTKYSCKKYSALLKYKEKTRNHPIYKEYVRAYNRKFSHKRNGVITDAEFKKWVNDASYEKNKVLELYDSKPSELLIKEFKSYLGNK